MLTFYPTNYTECPSNLLNIPPPLPKVNFREERARKKEMLEAAKAKNNPTKQPVGPSLYHTEETSSLLQSQEPTSSFKARPQAREHSPLPRGHPRHIPTHTVLR
ncbi:hypothetical protein TNCV_339381 [Trichonephila clavipes]|nr:hypothetical protein TNCV_339381 [Trichonephila clavipes]